MNIEQRKLRTVILDENTNINLEDFGPPLDLEMYREEFEKMKEILKNKNIVPEDNDEETF